MGFWDRILGRTPIHLNLPTASPEPVVEDAPISIGPIRTVSKPVEVKPKITNVQKIKRQGISYMTTRGAGRGTFEASEYDLVEVHRAADTDGYMAEAFRKKIGLMFKEGYDFVGSNPRTIQYIKARLAQIEQATDIPTEELLADIGTDLVKLSNAFLLKVREPRKSGGRMRTDADGKTFKPVAGYFPLPAETMEVDADMRGRIHKWRQKMPDGFIKEYKPADIVHIYFDKKKGFVFGTPTVVPVLDDIRALRKIEENVELLIYQCLFPLFHYKVGTENAPAGVTEDGSDEIDLIRDEIRFMPSEGGLVTSERHEITAIGSEGRALRAEGYLDHFKKRVFAGLGVSAIDLGEAETANRATAQVLSGAIIDSVKSFQYIMEFQFCHQVIKELLLESTFGESVLDEDNIVCLKFAEIDLDKKIAVEEHAAEMFKANGITLAEYREISGRQMFPIPMTPEEDDPEQFPEWHLTAWKLFDENKALIQSMDELSPASRAAAESRATQITPENIKKADEEQIRKEKAAKPPRPAAVRNFADNFLTSFYNDLEETILSYTDKKGTVGVNYLNVVVRAQGTRMIRALEKEAFGAFLTGYASVTAKPLDPHKSMFAREEISNRATRYVGRLTNSITNSLLRKVIDSAEPDDNISIIRSIFSGLRFRADFISDVELRKAWNYGVALGRISLGNVTALAVQVNDECTRCTESAEDLKRGTLRVSVVPPFHANCQCDLQFIKE